MQYEHMLLQPRMIETNADTPSVPSRTGAISAYVSSSESATPEPAPAEVTPAPTTAEETYYSIVASYYESESSYYSSESFGVELPTPEPTPSPCLVLSTRVL